MPTTAGPRRVEVRRRGYFPSVRRIDITKGERAHVEINLKQRGRYLLIVGLIALPVAAAAEGTRCWAT